MLEVRNARFRPDGVLEAGSTVRHQRRFHFLNFQALPWLEATFRLTERLDGTTGAGMTNDRAFDVKVRLVEESDWLPALAIGLSCTRFLWTPICPRRDRNDDVQYEKDRSF